MFPTEVHVAEPALATAMCRVMSGIMISTSARRKVSEEREKIFRRKNSFLPRRWRQHVLLKRYNAHTKLYCHIIESSHLFALILYVWTVTRFRSYTTPRVISCRQRDPGTGSSPNTSAVTYWYHSTSAQCLFVHLPPTLYKLNKWQRGYNSICTC
jgi:hypothetical protein